MDNWRQLGQDGVQAHHDWVSARLRARISTTLEFLGASYARQYTKN